MFPGVHDPAYMHFNRWILAISCFALVEIIYQIKSYLTIIMITNCEPDLLIWLIEFYLSGHILCNIFARLLFRNWIKSWLPSPFSCPIIVTCSSTILVLLVNGISNWHSFIHAFFTRSHYFGIVWFRIKLKLLYNY